jgi:CubicO group peptidase (beta-lactamase class C family)
MDGATRFEIGSITKTFTGILLADMILAGEIAPGQRVATLFPEAIALDNGVQEATLEALATHASGLPRIAVDLESLARTMSLDPYRGSTPESVFRSVARVPAAVVVPTESVAYSNLGYALLGRLLERRGGRPYEELLRRRVLEPLGLGGIATAHVEPRPFELARGHGPGGRPVPYWHVDGYAPAGCLLASADEMLDYVAIQLAAAHPAVAEAQRRRRNLPGGGGIGFGWMHDEVAGHRLVWHNGGTGGFRSFVGFLPEEDRGFVVLANGQGDVDALARRLLDPAEPPLLRHDANALVGIGITGILLAWGPLTLAGALRRARRSTAPFAAALAPAAVPVSPAGESVAASPPGGILPAIDRLDIARSPLSPAIALVLAVRMGAWQEVPFGLWWGALVVAVVACTLLLRRARALPWHRAGIWRNLRRALSTALELSVLALMFA